MSGRGGGGHEHPATSSVGWLGQLASLVGGDLDGYWKACYARGTENVGIDTPGDVLLVGLCHPPSASLPCFGLVCCARPGLLSQEDIAFKQKQKEEAKKLKEAAASATKGKGKGKK